MKLGYALKMTLIAAWWKTVMIHAMASSPATLSGTTVINTSLTPVLNLCKHLSVKNKKKNLSNVSIKSVRIRKRMTVGLRSVELMIHAGRVPALIGSTSRKMMSGSHGIVKKRKWRIWHSLIKFSKLLSKLLWSTIRLLKQVSSTGCTTTWTLKTLRIWTLSSPTKSKQTSLTNSLKTPKKCWASSAGTSTLIGLTNNSKKKTTKLSDPASTSSSNITGRSTSGICLKKKKSPNVRMVSRLTKRTATRWHKSTSKILKLVMLCRN